MLFEWTWSTIATSRYESTKSTEVASEIILYKSSSMQQYTDASKVRNTYKKHTERMLGQLGKHRRF